MGRFHDSDHRARAQVGPGRDEAFLLEGREHLLFFLRDMDHAPAQGIPGQVAPGRAGRAKMVTPTIRSSACKSLPRVSASFDCLRRSWMAAALLARDVEVHCGSSAGIFSAVTNSTALLLYRVNSASRSRNDSAVASASGAASAGFTGNLTLLATAPAACIMSCWVTRYSSGSNTWER